MKYYVIAGEASGDLHGANLIKELNKLDGNAYIRCWGGEKMEMEGGTLVKHYRELAFMGFVEVIKNLRTIFKNLAYCKQDIIKYNPDIVVLIDYPGFNLRIAEWAKLKGFKVIYYISPQVWAWKENRIKSIKKNVDKMLVILPFEKEFYKKRNYEVEYVGHPLLQVVDEYIAEHAQFASKNAASGDLSRQAPNNPIVALLPGSRQQEILKKLPVMLGVSKHFPEYHFVVAKAPGIADDFYDKLLSPYQNVSSVLNKTYLLLSTAKAALVTSGTATLETALFGVPEVVCYKGNSISFQIAKRLVQIKFICLVNLIMNREVIKELIQDGLTVKTLSEELRKILFDEEKKAQLKKDYLELRNLLCLGGNASSNAANIIWAVINRQ